jgi:hypothetical protein
MIVCAHRLVAGFAQLEKDSYAIKHYKSGKFNKASFA